MSIEELQQDIDMIEFEERVNPKVLDILLALLDEHEESGKRHRRHVAPERTWAKAEELIERYGESE